MKRINTKLKNFVLLLFPFLFLAASGCNEEPTASLFDPNASGGLIPVINSIEPAGGALAGVTKITINGANFSNSSDENFIYFNGVKGTLIESSASRLVVVPPQVISDSVKIKIAVHGATLLSNVVNYKISPAVAGLIKPNGEEIFTDLYVPNAITTDAQGNLYVSIIGPDPGVKKISPSGVATDFAPKGAETFWKALKFGPDGMLYGSKNQPRGIWKISEGVAPPNQPWGNIPNNIASNTIDIDQDEFLNVWAVGNANNIVMFSKEAVIKSFPFTANSVCVRVFNNALYVAGNKDNIEGVWRFPITGNGTIGAEELYFNYTQYDSSKVNAITFAADGDLYIGTNKTPDPIIIVHPDKSVETLYPGVITAKTEVMNFAWDPGNYLYFTRNLALNTDGSVLLAQKVFKVDLQKPGAPYYGR